MLLLAVLATTATIETAAAETPDSCPLWIISSRSVSCCRADAAAVDQLCYWRWDQPQRQWLESDADAFHQTDDPEVPTTVFIHGNRAGFQDAVRDGRAVHRRLCCLADGQPLRLVIWAWPADRVRGGHRRDAQIKAARSDVHAHYLALWIGRLDSRQRLNLIGYSFGARIITGAGHLLGGGRLAGQGLPRVQPADERPTCRAMLVAAAADCDSLLPGRRNGLALEQFDRVLVTRNACDPVLRWYHRMDRCRDRQALGLCGPACSASPYGSTVQETLDVACSVGRDHSWTTYFSAPAMQGRLAWYAFLDPPEE